MFNGASIISVRSLPGDDLIDWNSGVSGHPYVHKKFSNFDLIWCVGRPRSDMHTNVSSTDLRSRSRSQSTFLGLSTPPYLAWSTKLMVGGCQSLIFELPSRKAITRVHTLQDVDISRNSNGHISVVRDATVRWLGMLVVLHILWMLTWPWPDTRSRSLTFWSSENPRTGQGYNLVIVIAGSLQQAVHAGGNDRQPPCGAFLLNEI